MITMLKTVLWVSLLKLYLITRYNPRVLNPGPPSKQTSLSVYYQNVQGLIPFTYLAENHPKFDETKLCEIHSYIYKTAPDIIILNETWLKPTIHSNEIIPPQLYNTFRCDRSQMTHPNNEQNPNKFRVNGGGVLLSIKSSLSVTSNKIKLKCKAELLAIEIILDDKSKIIVATCYRVGTLGTENADEILRVIQMLTRKKSVRKYIFIGDLNLKGINWENGTARGNLENKFLNGFAELGLVQCLKHPTHIKGGTLDVLFTTSESYINNLKVGLNEAHCNSDHYPITFEIKVKCKRIVPPKRKCYDYSNVNWVNLNRELNNVSWEGVIDYMEPETAWHNFTKILFCVIDKHIPKIVVRNEHNPPWFDSECYQKCKQKNILHKKFKNNKSISNELKFKLCRKEFKELVKSKMRSNLNDPQRNTLTKKFWSYVKSATKSAGIPETIFMNGKSSCNPVNKANMFNQHFFRQFSSASKYDIDIDFYNDEISDIDFSQNVVKRYLDDIDTNKTQGPDNISGVVLKKCSEALCHPLSIIFQIIYNTGLIPQQWKLANVVPIFKKGDKKDVSNYRPISLTCLTAKVMERILYEKILFHTENLIDSRQHGFLRNKSCSTNMISLTESLSVSLLNKVSTDIIYFDFAKAFDSVCHDLILTKLKNQYGIDGRLLKFLKSYLQNRKQRVVLDNYTSDTIDVLSGVPQGSIIGPLLFVLFINDIYKSLNNSTNVALYADDTKMWRQINSNKDCEILQKDINLLYEWCAQNKMKFHPEKCKVLTVSNNETPAFIDELPFTTIFYTIGQDIIDYTDSKKDLGIYMNAKLDWSEHQAFILNKAHQMLGLTKRTCHFITDLRRRRSLYLTLV